MVEWSLGLALLFIPINTAAYQGVTPEKNASVLYAMVQQQAAAALSYIAAFWLVGPCRSQ
jgi:hypothetical protein